MRYPNPDARNDLNERRERLHRFVVGFGDVVLVWCSSTSTVAPATPVFNVRPPLPTSPRLKAGHINRIHLSAGSAGDALAVIINTSAFFTLQAARAFSPVIFTSLAHKPPVHSHLSMEAIRTMMDISLPFTQSPRFRGNPVPVTLRGRPAGGRWVDHCGQRLRHCRQCECGLYRYCSKPLLFIPFVIIVWMCIVVVAPSSPWRAPSAFTRPPFSLPSRICSTPMTSLPFT
jgi:hypothetical protein